MTLSSSPSCLHQSLQENLLYRITNRIRQSLQLQDILQTTVTEIRAFLETDRVIVYRFHPDAHGEVIAEAIHDDRLPSLMGLHFPADDIPPHARELFVQSRQRSIVDLSTGQIGWSLPRLAEETEPLLDDIRYRPVDPCHIEYLKAMGVQSSVVVPILQGAQLWGLLVAHHSKPRAVSEAELHFLQLVVDQVTIAIAQSTLLMQVQAQAFQERVANQVSTLLHGETTNPFKAALEAIVEAIGGAGGRLMLLPSSMGQSQELWCCGSQPTHSTLESEAVLEHHALWQAALLSAEITILDLYADPRYQVLRVRFKDTLIRNLLIVPLQQGTETIGCLTLFRNAIDTETLWAGKVDPDMRQTMPRRSFEQWRQHKSSQAREWTEIDLNLVAAVKNHFAMSIGQYQLQSQVQALNASLKQQVQLQSRDLANIQFALDQSSIVAMTDHQGILCYVNDKFCEISKYDRHELLGQSHHLIRSGYHPEAFFVQMWQTVNQGRIWRGEVKNRAKDGTDYWVDKTIVPLLNEQGKPYQFVAIENNITDRKQVETALQEQLHLTAFRAEVDASLTRGETLQEMLHDCTEAMVSHLGAAFARIWLFNAQDNMLELKASSGLYTHLDGDHARVPVGKFKIGLIAEERQPHLTNAVLTDPRVGNKEWAKREGMVAFAGYPLTVGQQLLGVMAMFARQPLSASTLDGLGLVSQEVALGIQRQQAEMALRQSEIELREKAQQLEQTLHELQHTQAQLVQTEKMSSLGQLVAGVAHEINNPVNFIYGNLLHVGNYASDLLNLLELYHRHYPNSATLIEAEAKDIDLEFLKADLPKLLSSMKVGADRIQKIVLALRTFSRMDEAEVKAVNVHDGIDSTLMILQSRLKGIAGHVEIKVMKAYGNLPLIECYAGQLNQVFMNILSNAIDALDDFNRDRSIEDIQNNPGTITIETEQVRDHFIQIRIADTGIGMSEQVQRRLFEPFFTTKPVGKGTGLGLSISYQVVVDKHGGTLTCHSAPGEGTQFVIELPLTLKHP